MTSPTGLDPALGGANEIPITTPVGLDPGADGTYPILGDPTLGTIPSSPATTSTGGGGLVNDVMQVANELGASQAIDLLKGVLMPSIMQAVQNGGAAAPAASPPVPPIPAAAAVPPTDPITVPVA
ncbi:cell surface protein [Mycobacterium tuberculosis]|nr:cell surface protein [Mycobacterium tuberculosis]QEX91699.1 cell surface protein [Mycobacterium tuberculosis]